MLMLLAAAESCPMSLMRGIDSFFVWHPGRSIGRTLEMQVAVR